MGLKLILLFIVAAFMSSLANASELNLYLKGGFNDWGEANPLHFKHDRYLSSFKLKKGKQEFIITNGENNLEFNIESSGNTFKLRGSEDTVRSIISLRPYEDNKAQLPYLQNSLQVSTQITSSYRLSLLPITNEDHHYQLEITQIDKTNEHLCRNYTEEWIDIDVSNTFVDGTELVNASSGEHGVVFGGIVSFPNNGQKALLIEELKSHSLNQANEPNDEIFYFIITDRFKNADQSNDLSYGRFKDGKNEIGTFHGGDLKGITSKLDYIEQLGVTSVVISPPFEQIHGWVGGGRRGDFPHFGYHGYYVKDFREIDNNFGTKEDLKDLADALHSRGMQLIVNIPLNHVGYATLQDMQADGFGEIKPALIDDLPTNWTQWKPKRGESWHDFNKFIDYKSPNWENWWGRDWVRAGIYNYPKPGRDDRTSSIYFLPDLLTEATNQVSIPQFLRKEGALSESKTVREHLIGWVTDLITQYGVNGFFVDAEKHVEPETWEQLRIQSDLAYANWISNNKELVNQKNINPNFYMMGESFGLGPRLSSAHSHGFDSMLNFDFQKAYQQNGIDCVANMDTVYHRYSELLQKQNTIGVSYLSSPDTHLNSQIHKKMNKDVYNSLYSLAFSPGTIQLFYGDEINRTAGPSGSDRHQGTRSDMNWLSLQEPETKAVLQEWKKLLNFRRNHPSISSGIHKTLNDYPYTFSRQLGDDKIIVVVL